MQVEPFAIEPARAGDRDQILGLLDAAGVGTDDLKRGAPVDFLVMRDKGRLVGAVGLQNVAGIALLRSLVVASEVQGQGRGSALVMAAERLALRRGAEELYLLTNTAPKLFALLDYWRIEPASVPTVLHDLAPGRSFGRGAVAMRKRLGVETEHGDR